MTNLILFISVASYLAIQSTFAARGGGSGGTGASSGSSYCYDDQGRVVDCPNQGLSTGAIVGIVIGIVAFLAIIVGILLFIRRTRRQEAAAASIGVDVAKDDDGKTGNGARKRVDLTSAFV